MTNSKRKNFAKINTKNAKTNIFVDRTFGMISPWMTLVGGISSVMVVWLASGLIKNGEMAIGEIMASIKYVSQVSFTFMMLSMIFTFAPWMFVSIDRIRKVQETDLTVLDAKKLAKIPKIST